jgi:glucan phosphoethanolaminetransferase (alkaline phosphatase superfamily)
MIEITPFQLLSIVILGNFATVVTVLVVIDLYRRNRDKTLTKGIIFTSCVTLLALFVGPFIAVHPLFN